MPGAALLRHALDDAAVLHHDVVGRDIGSRRAQVFDRGLALRHPGIMQHQHVDLGAAYALAKIRRRAHLGDEDGIGMKFGIHGQPYAEPLAF